MSGLLYFLPNRETCESETLADFGLQDIFRDASPDYREGLGPDDRAGVIVRVKPEFKAPGANLPPLFYAAESQKWEEVGVDRAPGEVYWIGFEVDNPPTPADLQRGIPGPLGGGQFVAGWPITLEGGHDWIVALVKRFGEPQQAMMVENIMAPSIPRALTLDYSTREWSVALEPLPRFKSITEKAERLWKIFEREYDGANRQDDEDFGASEIFDTACEALAVNYRLGGQEVSFLGLLTTRNTSKILEAMIDVPTFIECARRYAERQSEKEAEEIPAAAK